MNTARLKQLVEALINAEEKYEIQQHLNNLSTASQNYSNNPTDSRQQIEFFNKLTELQNQLSKLIAQCDPPQISQFKEIGAIEYFSPELTTKIYSLAKDNRLSPAIVYQVVMDIRSQRAQYFSNIEGLVFGLNALGFETEHLEEGEQEVGFQFPRSIFDNELDGLVRELKALRRIIRAFAEAAHGTVESIEVRSISTSDPIFFFGLKVSTIVAIGAAITWALHTWERVETIRKIRAEASKTEEFTAEEIAKSYDDKVISIIEQSVKEETEKLVNDITDKARKEEQTTDIQWALSALLARIERGMTVEIRFLPPPEEETEVAVGEENYQTSKEIKLYRELEQITPNLSFPKIEGEPILQIEHPKNDDAQEGE